MKRVCTESTQNKCYAALTSAYQRLRFKGNLRRSRSNLRQNPVREYLGEIGASILSSSLKMSKRHNDALARKLYQTRKNILFIERAGRSTRFIVEDALWNETRNCPETHPGLFPFSKGTLPVRVLLDGKPLANFPCWLCR